MIGYLAIARGRIEGLLERQGATETAFTNDIQKIVDDESEDVVY